MKRWDITYRGCMLPFMFVTETYGDTEEEAIDYAERKYSIERNRILSIEETNGNK